MITTEQLMNQIKEMLLSNKSREISIALEKTINETKKELIVINKNLLRSIKAKDIESIKSLLNQGGSSYQDKDGETLRAAIKTNNLEIIKLLKENGTDLNKEFNDGLNAISIAIRSSDIEIIKYLKDNGASVHVKDGYNLKLAIEKDRLDVVEYLIEEGISIKSYQDQNLATACVNNKTEMIKYLVNKGIKINDKNYYSSSILIAKGRLDLLKFLIEKGLNIKENNSNILLKAACGYGQLDIIKYLVEELKYDIKETDKNGNIYFTEAMHSGNKEVLDYILKNISNKQEELDKKATLNMRNLESIKYLINSGAKIIRNNFPTFHNNVTENKTDIISYLLTKENVKEIVDFNAELKTAALKSNYEIMELLLINGAQPNKIDLETTKISEEVKQWIKTKCFSMKLEKNLNENIKEVKKLKL